jgi:pimeloyl-ACP methyl ester carboxylesterase
MAASATVHHRYASVRGRPLFYREAGPTGAPAVVVLHGFPASSFMFRNLIPMPPGLTADLLGQLGVTRNGNGYEAGFVGSFWKPVREFWQHPGRQTEAPIRQALYPRLHACLRERRVPLLAVWGRNDEIFGPDGPRAFADDAPGEEIHLPDGGHFLLESHPGTAARTIRHFLERTLS